MRLLDYMQTVGLDDEAMARLIGDCSPGAVKKYKYGEREPNAERMARIEIVTKGSVRLQDWAAESVRRRQKAEAA